jgi:hypothetical protein
MPTQKQANKKKADPKGAAQSIPNQSRYDLFRGRLTFTTEPTCLRIVLVVLVLAAPIILILLVHHYALPALGIRWLGNLPGIRGLLSGKGRSP